MSELIRTEHLCRTLTGEVTVTLVDDVDLRVDRGQFMVITGPSGSGKSSLLYLLGLLDKPSSGKLWFMGKDTAELGEKELADIRLAEIGFVFQFHFLLPEFTALENVTLPMQRLGQLSSSEMISRAKALLEKLGVGEHHHKRPGQLSGGQSQRVAIARALANQPRVILADEPTGNLDSAASEAVREMLRALAEDDDRAVITVTHDSKFSDLADVQVTIIDGHLDSRE